VRYINSGTMKAESDHYSVGKIALVDAKAKQKHFPLKDDSGLFIGGPIGDSTLDGGRIYVVLEPGQQGIVWAYFDALAPGTVVSVEVPQMFPFDDVVVTEGPGTLLSAGSARTTPSGVVATLASVKRADQALYVRVTFATETGVTVKLRSPYFEYKDVYLFDPVGKRKCPLLKDSEGFFQAQPLTVKMGGGRFIPDWGKPILMSLTFQAPPDSVTSLDLILPDFVPFEAVQIAALGGAAAGGVDPAGKTPGTEGALQGNGAGVTPADRSGSDTVSCLGADAAIGIPACTRVIAQSSPDSPEQINAYVARSKHYTIAEDLDRALADTNEALQRDPVNADALHNRALVHYYLGHFDEAMADINKEMAARPDDAECHATRARFLAEAGQTDAALKDLDRAIEIDPRHVDALNSRGAIRTMTGQMDPARADFDAVLAIDPQNADAYSSRGAMYLMTSRFPQALEDLEQAIRLDPANSMALLNRGMTYFFLKQFEPAIADFSRALTLEPGNAHLHYQRAVAGYMSGRTTEALADADQVIRSQPDHLQAHQLRATILEATERLEEAESAHRQVLKLDPTNAIGQQALQRLGAAH